MIQSMIQVIQSVIQLFNVGFNLGFNHTYVFSFCSFTQYFSAIITKGFIPLLVVEPK